jgi:hypothetical protein
MERSNNRFQRTALRAAAESDMQGNGGAAMVLWSRLTDTRWASLYVIIAVFALLVARLAAEAHSRIDDPV